MHKYAYLTKNDSNSYDVFNILRNTSFDELPGFVTRLEPVFEAGTPIVGMKVLTNLSDAGVNAVWDGNSFTGGKPFMFQENLEMDWDSVNLYVFLADNKVVLTQFISKNSPQSDLFEAAFTQDVTLVKVQDDQVAAIGYTWDGTNFNPPA